MGLKLKAKLKWQQSGEPYSDEFDDVYFSKTSGVEEAEYVFLKHNNLKERFKKAQDQFIIAETGFGTGLNFLKAVQLWQENANDNAHLYYYSAEKYPLNKDDLIKALSIWHELKNVAQKLIENYPKTFYSGIIPIEILPNITLILLIDDAAKSFKQLNIKVDAWFLDGFAPSKNPEMWSEQLFKEMAKLSQNYTTFATFTAASNVRKALENVGFDVVKDKGFAKKREMIYGIFKENKMSSYEKYKPWFKTQFKNKKLKNVAIIGAGLAGCALAYELSKSGLNITIYDKNNEIAKEASGNQIGLSRFYPSMDLNLSDQFHSMGFLILNQFVQNYQEKLDVKADGLLQLISQKEINWFEKIEQKRSLDEDIIQLLNSDEIKEKFNIETKNHGFYFKQGLSISPKSLCNLWLELAKENINLKLNTEVIKLEDNEKYWNIKTKNEQYNHFDAVIIAGGYQALKAFDQTKEISVFASVGQLNTVKLKEEINVSISAGGYLSPSFNKNEYIIGATFRDNDDLSFDHRQSDLEDNLKILQKLNINHYEVIDSRCSMRCVTSDHLPLIGLLPDFKKFRKSYYLPLKKGMITRKIEKFNEVQKNNNLYILSGFGSKGLASSLYGAKILKQQILGKPELSSIFINEAINPTRFWIKAFKERA